MLQELRIQDFAIIDKLHLRFAPGFNIITGETGAGKSILIDAVDFALGGRAEAGFIRAGAKSSTVELFFHIPPRLRSELRSALENNELPAEDVETLRLSRELRDSGRSSAKINDQACKLNSYKEISSLLLDIHGQTDHLSLFKAKSHLYLLDSFANLDDQREAIAAQVRKLRGVRQSMDSIRRSERERAQRVDMLKFQIQEIEAVRLKDGEEQELREERNRLANAERLATLSREAYQALYAEDEFGHSGVNALNRVAGALRKLAALDSHLEEASQQADSLAELAEDLAQTLQTYQEGLEVSPGRLDQTEERLEMLTRLKRKYGDSIPAILETAERARQELEAIEHGEERLEHLAQEEEVLLRSIGEFAGKLSQRRRAAGDRLAGQIEEQLKDLKMPNARFQVAVNQEEDPSGCHLGDERLAFDQSGIDTVEFMLSANLGEPLRPLAQVASGGETARIMLALKTVLSAADRTPTLIFDEVDQGIGGRLGLVIGEKLWGLAAHHQVLVVTHLAQIAGFADRHFKVEKAVEGQRTLTLVNPLEGEGRLYEIADMLGGVSDSSLKNAQELMAAAQALRKK
jgi:DNA repair protein RecN (Recombination protein N)